MNIVYIILYAVGALMAVYGTMEVVCGVCIKIAFVLSNRNGAINGVKKSRIALMVVGWAIIMTLNYIH